LSVDDRSIRAVPAPRPTTPPPPTTRVSETDACPGALRLHAAADGPLARVRLPGGLLTGPQLAVLGGLAERWGDGGLELTSRANVQLRALTAADTADLAARLSAAGLLPSDSHETVRNIAAPALADAPTRDLVAELDRRLCADPALAALPGRFLFAIGEVPLDADLAAVPTAPTGSLPTTPTADVPTVSAGDMPAATAHPAYAILFGGADAGLRVRSAEVVHALLTAAHAFLAERERAGTPEKPAWRLRELADGPARVARRTAEALGAPLSADPTATASRSPGQAMAGVVAQGGGLFAAAALVPLGRLDAEAIGVLATADRVVVTPSRGVVVPDLTAVGAQAWVRRLAAAGLAVEPDSRWAGVTACAGRPGCAKSLADVRTDADAATRHVAGLPVHWVGCARGCGSPAGPHVRVEATPAGYVVTREPADPPERTGRTAADPAEQRGRAAADPPGAVGGAAGDPVDRAGVAAGMLADLVAARRR
jgi:precorrin-3B synthase